MSYKVEKSIDRFSNKTTIKMNKKCRISSPFISVSQLKFRHCSIKGEFDSILIDYYWTGSYNYIETSGNNLIIRINNNENITLPFEFSGDRECSRHTDNNGNVSYTYYEYNYVKINKQILEKICDATNIEFKVVDKEYSGKKAQDFINYSRIFYNGLYSENKYHIDDTSLGLTSIIMIIAFIITILIILFSII